MIFTTGGCDLDTEHCVIQRCQSLVRVHNPGDRLCLARAILLGLRDRQCRQPAGGGRNAFQRLHVADQRHHGPEARNLLRRAGISRRKHLYGLEDVDCLQRWLNTHHGPGQIRLVVFQKEQQYRIVYKGDNG